VSGWNKILYYFNRIEKYLVVGFYSYFTFIIVFEVIRRYLFHSASQWGEETGRYAFVYMSFIGGAEAIKSRSHLKIDMLQRMMNRTQLFLTYLFTDAMFILLAVLIIRFSIKVIGFQVEMGTVMQGLDWNMAWAHVAVPIGWALILVRLIQRVVITVRAYIQGEEVEQHAKGMLDEEVD